MDNILKISLTLSLIGILLLLIMINNQPIQNLSISKISNDHLNKQIAIQGQVINLKTHPTLQIITIQSLINKTSQIPVIAYNSNLTINTTNNSTFIIIGKVQQYNNQLEIIADKIIIKN